MPCTERTRRHGADSSKSLKRSKLKGTWRVGPSVYRIDAVGVLCLLWLSLGRCSAIPERYEVNAPPELEDR